MNVKIEDLGPVKKKLSFEIGAAAVDKAIDQAYEKIGRSAKVKGFRPGKVPRALLERYYSPQMQEQVLDELIRKNYFQALADHQIAAVASPTIVDSSLPEKGKPFSFEAHVEIRPEVVASGYQGLRLERETFVPDEQVVLERLEEMRQARANLESSTRKVARKGDFVTIHFEGRISGEPIPGGEGRDYLLELGSASFIPGFEEAVIGMKRGEEKSFEINFPDNYGNQDLAGKPAVFRVELVEIKEKVAPELGDEFAKEFGLGSVAELRERIAENYRAQEESRIREAVREQLMEALIAANPFEVPGSMVASQLDYMLENARNRLRYQGLTLEMLGMDDARFREQYHQAAVKQVQGSLLLEAVARQEGLQVDAGEIDAKLQEIASQANAPIEAVRERYANDESRAGLMGHLLEEKAIELLLSKAQIKEKPATKKGKGTGKKKASVADEGGKE